MITSKKHLLLIGYNFYPEPTGIGKYNGEMIAWLAKKGYTCTVITTYPYYPYWKVQEPYFKNRFSFTTEVIAYPSGGKITICRCPIYVPAKPSGIKRIILDLSFLFTALIKLIHLLCKHKFEYVITIAPAFELGFLGILCKFLQKSTFIYHIQDMQIEAARDLHMIKSAFLIKVLFKIERFIFDKSDFITTISEAMAIKIHEKSEKKVHFFPNWADTSLFFPIQDKCKLKTLFGFSNAERIVLYSGAIGEKQGLENILYVANQFRENHTNIKFIICGSGPYKDHLIRLAQELNLTNIQFFPVQPLEKFNYFLNLADVHLVIQKCSTCDLVMPSKLTTILAIGD
ncbi:WcaI family glycosyltransferase [Hymenobacter radiodurans]|uniref:WcaI family glycosyltransferase n=1 Tax=Hymenobacter radiodurans TaxID=2496028 RepID=UPI00196B4413|nr:WcaI family glycosyltransferase [Hymenobacter radiodurans]